MDCADGGEVALMCQPRTFDYDAALDRWECGLKARRIAQQLKINQYALEKMIVRMRERGDHRAVRRNLVNGVKKYPARASA